MRMTLHFLAGEVYGGGSDDSGPFDVIGAYSPEEVDLIKAYGTYAFQYHGKWDGSMIFGRAHQVGNPGNFSVFEMWPEGEETQVDFALEEELAKA
jgi:hypothetical protein